MSDQVETSTDYPKIDFGQEGFTVTHTVTIHNPTININDSATAYYILQHPDGRAIATTYEPYQLV